MALVAQLLAGDGSTKLFNFYIMKIQNWGITSDAINYQGFPSIQREWMFDGVTRSESLTIETVMVPSTYDSSNPGTGAFMDQLADLFYTYRNQGLITRTISPSSNPYLILNISMTAASAVDATHTPGNLTPLAQTGFTAGSAVYNMTCIIDDVRVIKIDNLQKYVTVAVTFRRVGRVISYG